MSTTPITDIVEAVKTAAAATLVPILFGQDHISENDAPPRIVFVPANDDLASPTAVGGNPPSLHDANVTLVAHCWGRTFDEAWRLRQVMLTALRKVVTANYRLATASWSQSTVTALGYVCSQPISIRVPLVSSDLTSPAFDDSPATTAKATSASFDTSGETDGDGRLAAPNA